MQNTPENYKIAFDAFEKLSWMRGYPEEPNQIKERVLRLMKIVRNKPAEECIILGAGDNSYFIDNYKWDHDFDGYEQKLHGRHSKALGTPEQNDLEWIVDRIGEECDELPSQLKIREMYCEALTPEDRKRV